MNSYVFCSIPALRGESAAEPPVMMTQAPIVVTRTIYARIGDAFGWLCAAGFLGMIAWTILT